MKVASGHWEFLMDCGYWSLVRGCVCSVWGVNSGCKTWGGYFPFKHPFEEEQKAEAVVEIILLNHGRPRPPKIAADCTELSHRWQHLLRAGQQTEETSILRVFTQHACPWVGSPSDYPCSRYHVTRGNFPLWQQGETAIDGDDEPKAEQEH